MNESRTVGCLFLIIALSMVMHSESSAANIRMLTAARESTTKARNVSSATNDPQRTLDDDTKDVEKKVGESEEERQQRKDPAASRTSQSKDDGHGGTARADVGGSIMVDADQYFIATSSSSFGGDDISPNDALLSLSDLSTLDFETDGPMSFTVVTSFAGVTYDLSPFVLSLGVWVGDGYAPFSELDVPTIEGSSTYEIDVPAAGLFRFSMSWSVDDFLLPAGDSSFGIGSMSVEMVPEPATWLLMVAGLSSLALFQTIKSGCQDEKAPHHCRVA